MYTRPRDRNPERAKVAGRRRADNDERALVHGQAVWRTGAIKRGACSWRADHRQASGRPPLMPPLEAREARQPRHIERDPALVRVAHRRQGDLHRQQTVWVEADLGATQRHDRAYQQTSPAEQNHAHRDLHDDKRLPNARGLRHARLGGAKRRPSRPLATRSAGTSPTISPVNQGRSETRTASTRRSTRSCGTRRKSGGANGIDASRLARANAIPSAPPAIASSTLSTSN